MPSSGAASILKSGTSAPAHFLPVQKTYLRAGIPRLAGRIGRGAVVEDAPVGRPGPGPAQGVAEAGRVGGVAPGHLVPVLGPAPAEDPAARGGGAVGLQVGEGGELLPLPGQRLGLVLGVGDVGQRLAVELAGQLVRRGGLGLEVGPRHLDDGIREGAALLLVEGPQRQEDPGHDLGVAPGLARRLGRLPVPLQPAAAVDQRAVLLGEAGGREAEDLGLDGAAVDVVELAVLLPEGGGLGRERVDDHQVLELGEGGGQLALVGDRGQRVEALAEVPVDLPWCISSKAARMS